MRHLHRSSAEPFRHRRQRFKIYLLEGMFQRANSRANGSKINKRIGSDRTRWSGLLRITGKSDAPLEAPAYPPTVSCRFGGLAGHCARRPRRRCVAEAWLPSPADRDAPWRTAIKTSPAAFRLLTCGDTTGGLVGRHNCRPMARKQLTWPLRISWPDVQRSSVRGLPAQERQGYHFWSCAAAAEGLLQYRSRQALLALLHRSSHRSETAPSTRRRPPRGMSQELQVRCLPSIIEDWHRNTHQSASRQSLFSALQRR